MACTIVVGYMPGAIGKVTQLHAGYYHRNWGFGLYFEAKIATELAQFMQSFNPVRDGFWAVVDDQIVGSIAIVGDQSDARRARLRWLIVDPEYQGRGFGKSLLKEAVGFCRESNFNKVYLTTFAGLDVARRLYEQSGFTIIREEEGSYWGKPVLEQTFELIL
ncbi:MAG: GNAT family N-acetyltransferase [Deltaproteobacteria bacterium HGW-Deltaproteobacteria-10]|nr:MAG: GNAT family N-acetyltransferase [Deltaproteobacteria bacterium HGW-Deltaproteobacteria-10]